MFSPAMEIRQSLEANFLTCKHCHQPYRKPKVLVCLHTFCQSCLEEILSKREAELEAKEIEAAKRFYAASSLANDYRTGGYRRKWSSKFRYGNYDSNNYGLNRYNFTTTKDKRISCPVCEKETVLPSGGISDLPVDQLADKLASMVDRMPTFPVCDVCTKQLLLNEPVGNHTETDIECSSSNHQSAYSATERYGSSEDSSSSDEDGGYDDSLPGSKQNGSLSSDSGVKSGQPNRPARGHHSLHSSRQRYHTSNKGCKLQRRRRKIVSSSVRPGQSEAGPQPASAACLECAKRLCATCRDMHSKMAVTANHVLIRVDQMNELHCSRHPRELRRFFCLTCRAYICIVCTFETTGGENGAVESANTGGHANHDILSIRQAVTAYQNQLNRDSAATQAQVNQIEALLGSLQVCESEMQRLYAAIDAGAKAYIEQIHRQQSLLREKVNKVVGVPLDVLSSECHRLTHAANEWYEFLNDDRITSRLDLMDPLEALTEGGPMLDRVEKCLRAASEPLSRDLAKQQFLFHLEAAEETTQNGDSGLVSSQSTSPPSNANSAEPTEIEDNRITYWRTRLGQFQPGKLEFGRIITDKELAAEAIAEAARRVTTFVQTGPELIKSLPPPKGAQRHRAVQINLLGANLGDCGVQTDPVQISTAKPTKVDVGTQYVSADINPPVSMYRSLKQILVQK